jgi:hypothetical protein
MGARTQLSSNHKPSSVAIRRGVVECYPETKVLNVMTRHQYEDMFCPQVRHSSSVISSISLSFHTF